MKSMEKKLILPAALVIVMLSFSSCMKNRVVTLEEVSAARGMNQNDSVITIFPVPTRGSYRRWRIYF